MITITPILWSRKNAQGKYPVKIRITIDKKSKYIPLEFSLKKADWNNRSRCVRTSHGDHVNLNDQIEADIDRLNEIKKSLRNSSPSVEYFHQVATRKVSLSPSPTSNGSADFIVFTTQVIERLKVAKKLRNARNTRVMLNKVKKFIGESRPVLPFSEITVSFLKDFESYYIGNGNKVSTVAKDLARMRKMINEAIEESLMEPELSPFVRYRIKNGKPKAKSKLSNEELQLLFEVHVPENSLLWHVQNVFRFQFYTGGMRIADCLQLKWINVVQERIHYQMDKTEASPSLSITESIQSILDCYMNEDALPEHFIFPFLSDHEDYSDLAYLLKRIEAKTALINKYIKILAKKAGIEKSISTHVARHSMADYLRRSKQDIYSISKVLRHSSIKTTETYLASLDQDATDSALRMLGEI